MLNDTRVTFVTARYHPICLQGVCRSLLPHWAGSSQLMELCLNRRGVPGPQPMEEWLEMDLLSAAQASGQ